MDSSKWSLPSSAAGLVEIPYVDLATILRNRLRWIAYAKALEEEGE